jgi:hypothetical protein
LSSATGGVNRERVADDEVGVEPPAEAAPEALGALDVRDWDHDDYELHVERSFVRGPDFRFGCSPP